MSVVKFFGAADGFLGAERGDHVLAGEGGLGRGHGEEASSMEGVGVEKRVFVEVGANPDRRLCLGCGGGWALFLRLVLRDSNQ